MTCCRTPKGVRCFQKLRVGSRMSHIELSRGKWQRVKLSGRAVKGGTRSNAVERSSDVWKGLPGLMTSDKGFHVRSWQFHAGFPAAASPSELEQSEEMYTRVVLYLY